MKRAGRLERYLIYACSAAMIAGAAGRSRAPSREVTFPDPRVQVFYYMWYQTPGRDGRWRHWNAMGRRPPADLASSYYPLLGPYSSSDAHVMERHLEWLQAAGVGTLIISFWGRDDPGPERLDRLAALSRRYGIRWSFLIEPYPGLTRTRLRADIRWLLNRYGTLMFQVRRATPDFPWDLPRPVLYVFNLSVLKPRDWIDLMRTYHQPSNGVAFILNDPLGTTAEWGPTDGFFTYTPAPADLNPLFHPSLSALARKRGLFFAATVAPGFQTMRYRTDLAFLETPRREGKLYHRNWRLALSLKPDWVAIISFNEWHEGTQIEPARIRSQGRYLDYLGDFGRRDSLAPFSYLIHTADWVKKWKRERESERTPSASNLLGIESHVHGSIPGAGVEIDQDHLLPGPQ